jgi:hypothetical protein
MRSLAGDLMSVLALSAITLVTQVAAQAQGGGEEGGPFEIEKCQTISQSGSYRLINNVTLKGRQGDTCLQVTADFVTIDLAGFTISWPGRQEPGNPTIAIAAGENTRGISVRNGSISGFGVGVNFGGDGSIVEGLRVDGPCPCESAIRARGIVRGNTVSVASAPNGSVGISATGIVNGNYVFNDRSFGIEVGEGSTVIGNTVTGTGGFPAIGLLVDCPSNVTNNTAVNNPGGNIVLNGNGCNDTNNVAP